MTAESSRATPGRTLQHPTVGRNARFRACLAVATGLFLDGCGGARPEIDVPAPSIPRSATLLDSPVAPVEVRLSARVTGHVRLLDREEGDLDLGPIVVYLEPHDESARTTGPAADVVAIVTREPFFQQPLAAVPSNRLAMLVNEGPLNHRLFAADLGVERGFELPPGGRSPSFRLPPLGPIRFFCSLHAEETFIVFSRRASDMTVVETDQPYSLGPVEPGRYTLAIWSPRVEGPVREVIVDGYSRRVELIWIDPLLVRRIGAVSRARP